MVDMDHIAKPGTGMDAAFNPAPPVSAPARDTGVATSPETGSTRPLSPAAEPNGGTPSSTWWTRIQDLPHYDPAYPYDPRHVYGPDFTDDDAYGKDGVHFMAGRAHEFSIDSGAGEARRRLGVDRVFREKTLRLPDLGVPKTNRYARSGQVIPDVFIQEHPRPGDNRHEVAYDPDNPILFVLEVLSESTFQHDLGPKVEIYRAMGVREFWRYDPERLHRKEDEPRLWGLHLSADDDYVDIEPVRMADGQSVYHSDVLGEFRMLPEGGDVHTLQTWDATRRVWLDPVRARNLVADEAKRGAVQEAVLRTAARTRMEDLLLLLRQHAEQGALAHDIPDMLAATWQEAQWVPDFAAALRVTNGERDWSTLLPPADHRT